MRGMCITIVALAACGGGGGPSVDATVGTVIDGVIIYPDVPVPDATSATTGAITATLRCGGAGCDKSGNIRLVVDDCAGGVPIANRLMPGKTLTAGVDITNTIDQVTPGMYCATSYLDVNTNGSLDAGDVIATAGATMVTVTAGNIETAVIVLDKLQS